MAETGQESVGCLDLCCKASQTCSPCPQGESQADPVDLGKTGEGIALVLIMAVESGTGRRKRGQWQVYSLHPMG